jgi:hypothetical protein
MSTTGSTMKGKRLRWEAEGMKTALELEEDDDEKEDEEEEEEEEEDAGGAGADRLALVAAGRARRDGGFSSASSSAGAWRGCARGPRRSDAVDARCDSCDWDEPVRESSSVQSSGSLPAAATISSR